MASKKKGKRRKKPTQLEYEQRLLRKDVREVFSKCGFEKVLSVSDKEFCYKGRNGDIDDVFVSKNVVVLTEYTCANESNAGDHLLKKKILFDHINEDHVDFLEFFESKFESFKTARNSFYQHEECKVVIVYCSRNKLSTSRKQQVEGIKYFDYSILRYFKMVALAIRLSAVYELLNFLEIQSNEYGVASQTTKKEVKGSLLPESYSCFPKGYKVVAFYIDAESLLQRSYVLRSDGWHDTVGAYQRMIVPAKIRSIRKYLRNEKRVFVNNVIVTLPSNTKLVDKNGNTLNLKKLTSVQPVIIQIPDGFNSVGLIDGQHRVFSYHEGGDYDDVISGLRLKQNLLVTGIIYKEGIDERDKRKFEAQLFLEINSTQTNAKSDLKHTIGLILKPYSSESIAKAVINDLNRKAPFSGCFMEHFFDKNKVKTSSIVSYGLKPLVKTSGNDSFYSIWENINKVAIVNESDEDILHDYISFCSEEISKFVSAVKLSVNPEQWTTDRSKENKILSTSVINGLIICLRMIVEKRQLGSVESYRRKLNGLEDFPFSNYKSSQYASMARDIYSQHFD